MSTRDRFGQFPPDHTVNKVGLPVALRISERMIHRKRKVYDGCAVREVLHFRITGETTNDDDFV